MTNTESVKTFGQIIDATYLMTSAESDHDDQLMEVKCWRLLLPWAFFLKLAQNLCKNLLFQTYVLIHQRPTRFREMIILVQNE